VRGLLDNRLAALLGVAGPLLFLAGVILVSWSERDFIAELGWDNWPSGTALGPNGWATVLVFLLTGLCQMAFARSLLAQAGASTVRKLGAGLLVVSGFGMAMLAFKTDHPDAELTWHGVIHVVAYFTFFLGLHTRLRCAGVGVVEPARALVVDVRTARAPAVARRRRAP